MIKLIFNLIKSPSPKTSGRVSVNRFIGLLLMGQVPLMLGRGQVLLLGQGLLILLGQGLLILLGQGLLILLKR